MPKSKRRPSSAPITPLAKPGPKGDVVPPKTVASVDKLVSTIGMGAAATKLGVARETIRRLLDGHRMRKGTILQVQAGLY
jgi:hypothetical protein